MLSRETHVKLNLLCYRVALSVENANLTYFFILVINASEDCDVSTTDMCRKNIHSWRKFLRGKLNKLPLLFTVIGANMSSCIKLLNAINFHVVVCHPTEHIEMPAQCAAAMSTTRLV